MSRKINFILTLVFSMALLTITAWGSEPAIETEPAGQSAAAENIPISHEPEFGGVYIHLTIEEFNELPFEYGDGVTVAFLNGYTLENIPYYNGYYVKSGEPLLIAYPGYAYIKAAINNGDDLWEVAELDETMTAGIYLYEKGEYLDTQNVRNLFYTDILENYPNEIVFANFRALTGGKLKPDTVYRSASPSDNQHNRALYADLAAKEAGINYVLDLADTEEYLQANVESETFESAYFEQLYREKKYSAIALNTRYDSAEFKKKLAEGLTDMISHEPPYLIHCTEGKDRTGFVCMLLEALCGASYEEIVRDYMITYENYYFFTLPQDQEKYDIIISQVLDPMIQIMTGSSEVDIYTADLSVCAGEYLASGGMDEQQIGLLYGTLTGEMPD